MAMLNADQSHVFHHVNDHLFHKQKHKIGSCDCADLQPLRMFLSVVGGTRKLVSLLKQ